MTERKKRLEKSRTPQKFSVHLTKANLETIKEIEVMLRLNSRNETINEIIRRFGNYLNYKDLIDAMQRHFNNGHIN